MRFVFLACVLGLFATTCAYSNGANAAARSNNGAATAAKPTVTISNVHGAPQIMVNGKIVVPMSFFGRIDIVMRTVSAGSKWQRHEFSFTADDDLESAVLRMYVQGTSPGNVWLDNLTVTDAETGEQAITYGNFENDTLASSQCSVFTYAPSGTEAKMVIDDVQKIAGSRSLALTVIKNPDGDTGWFQTRLYLQCAGIRTKKGRRYRVAFDLASDKDRYVSFDVQDANTQKSYMREEDSLFIDQVKLAAREGIHIHHLSLASVPFTSKEVEHAYKSIDRAFAAARAADPKGMFILRFGVLPDPYAGWYQAHPTEQMFNEKGEPLLMAEPCSEQWLAELQTTLTSYIKYIESKWGDYVLIYHPSAYSGAEWNYPGRNEHADFGFSPAVTSGFRRWLRAKYTSVGKLNITWQKQFRTFEEVTIPSYATRHTPTNGEFLHPVIARPLIDFYNFRNDSMAYAIERCGRIIKNASVLKRPVMFFYGYTFEINSSLVEGGHAKWNTLLKSPNADVYCAPTAYYGRPPGQSAYFHSPVDSVALHGKLWQNEDDVSTYLVPGERSVWTPATLEQTVDGHIRNFAHLYVRRMGCWYMDLLGNGWLDDPALWQNIGKLKAFWEQKKELPCTYAPEIALIADERSAFYLPYVADGSATAVGVSLLSNLRGSFGPIGAPVGYYLIDDFLANKVKAKLYVFMNALALNADQRLRINKILSSRKATALWFYAPGYVDTGTQQLSTNGISMLTGMSVYAMAQPVKDTLVKPAGSHLNWFTSPFGSNQQDLKSQWYIGSKGVTPLAVYQQAPDKVGAAMIKTDGYTSIFIAGLGISTELARNIARNAGVWIYCESGDTVVADANLIMLHAATDGTKTIRLQKSAQVSDCLSGEVVGTGTEIHLDMKRTQTRLLWRK